MLLFVEVMVKISAWVCMVHGIFMSAFQYGLCKQRLRNFNAFPRKYFLCQMTSRKGFPSMKLQTQRLWSLHLLVLAYCCSGKFSSKVAHLFYFSDEYLLICYGKADCETLGLIICYKFNFIFFFLEARCVIWDKLSKL